jgi:hypothetical protein
VACRQRNELITATGEKCIGPDHERACSKPDQGCKDPIEIAIGTRMQHADLQPEGASRRLHVFQLDVGSRELRIEEHGDDSGCGHQRVHQFKLLRPQRDDKETHAGDVAARPVEAGDKPERDRVGAVREHYRDRRRRRLGRERRVGGTACEDHRHLTAHKVGRQRRQPIKLILRPALFNRNVPSLDMAGFAQAPAERGHHRRVGHRCCAMKGPDHRHRRLLCVRRDRKCRRAAQQCDERTPFHSITSTARSSIEAVNGRRLIRAPGSFPSGAHERLAGGLVEAYSRMIRLASGTAERRAGPWDKPEIF